MNQRPSRYRLRRTARRLNRYGINATMPLTDGRELGPALLEVAVHWAWRYRSELAPAGFTLAVGIAGLVLHTDDRRSWPLLAGIAAATAIALAVFGGRAGLATRAERLYAALVMATAGGWLAVATALGPGHKPLPQVLVIAGLVLAVPWWAHRRRRAKVQVERKLAAWPEIACAIGLAGSGIQSVVIDVWGWRARFALARGQTIEDVVHRLPAIESALGTFRGAARVYPTSDDLADRCELRVLDTDPHADAITWPGPSVATITEPIDLGPFEDATPCRVLLLRRHALIGGVSGSGKSGGINVLMGNLSACRDVVIWAIDLKRGMELGPWAHCIDRLATTPGEARALLADAVTVLEARAALLAAAGRRIWEPTTELPALVIVVDEYAELADDAPEATGLADSIARRGRAVAVTLIAATQRPTQKAMGQGALRSQMDVRVCFRVRERKDTDLILGQGMLAAGWQPHTLNAPGKFLISAPEHDVPRRARGYLLKDQAVAFASGANAGLRPELDEVSRRAVHERVSRPPSDHGADGDQPADPAADDTPTDGPAMGDPRRSQDHEETEQAPDLLLWAALSIAPEDGVTVGELMHQTRMSRPWVYQRLRDLTLRGQVTQASRGRWRAVTGHGQ